MTRRTCIVCLVAKLYFSKPVSKIFTLVKNRVKPGRTILFVHEWRILRQVTFDFLSLWLQISSTRYKAVLPRIFFEKDPKHLTFLATHHSLLSNSTLICSAFSEKKILRVSLSSQIIRVLHNSASSPSMSRTNMSHNDFMGRQKAIKFWTNITASQSNHWEERGFHSNKSGLEEECNFSHDGVIGWRTFHCTFNLSRGGMKYICFHQSPPPALTFLKPDGWLVDVFREDLWRIDNFV